MTFYLLFTGQYVDFTLVKEKLIQITALTWQMLGSSDQPENPQLILQQKMEILEFLVDATILYFIFPAEKLRKIQKLAQHLLHQQTVSVRGLATFVGKTSVLQKAILQAPLHYRAIQFL